MLLSFLPNHISSDFAFLSGLYCAWITGKFKFNVMPCNDWCNGGRALCNGTVKSQQVGCLKTTPPLCLQMLLGEVDAFSVSLIRNYNILPVRKCLLRFKQVTYILEHCAFVCRLKTSSSNIKTSSWSIYNGFSGRKNKFSAKSWEGPFKMKTGTNSHTVYFLLLLKCTPCWMVHSMMKNSLPGTLF